MSKSTAICLFGAPGCGKDYLLNNIFNKFNITEVNVDHLLSGRINISEQNIVITGLIDDNSSRKLANALKETHDINYIYVSVTNKISRTRNEQRAEPISEQKRLEKFYKAEKLSKTLENTIIFNNSITLSESSQMEQILFGSQIQRLLESLIDLGLVMDDGSVEEVDEKVIDDEQQTADFTPTLKPKKTKSTTSTPATPQNSTIDGLPVTSVSKG